MSDFYVPPTECDPVRGCLPVQPKSHPAENHNECAGQVDLTREEDITKDDDGQDYLNKEVASVSLEQEHYL